MSEKIDPWAALPSSSDVVNGPEKVVLDQFAGLEKYSDTKLRVKSEKVKLIYEETDNGTVTTATLIPLATVPNPFVATQTHHYTNEDFGYNPHKSQRNQVVRYRFYIVGTYGRDFEYALLSIKYPLIQCYPVSIYHNQSDYSNSARYFGPKGEFPLISTEDDLKRYCADIITSVEFIRVVSRLKSL